ncbi:ferredoxin [Actinacidiphila alni]|uniref:ferredoxin n=1 Tax=Actinacidiphila alni TaxID=380248 RepID=UPI0033E55DE8
MAYVISGDCIDVLDRSCVEVCPVDCIYEGSRKAYIHPDECVDCGACEPVCPVTAIAYRDDVPAGQAEFVEDNARFFLEPLPGRDQPLGRPGGSNDLGPTGIDTALVSHRPARPGTT